MDGITDELVSDLFKDHLSGKKPIGSGSWFPVKVTSWEELAKEIKSIE
jgi:hypothetical protein